MRYENSSSDYNEYFIDSPVSSVRSDAVIIRIHSELAVTKRFSGIVFCSVVSVALFKLVKGIESRYTLSWLIGLLTLAA